MESFKNVWMAIDKVVFGIVKHVCVIMLAALVAVVFYIFLGRYVLHASPAWGEPLSLLLLTWMSILGSTLVLRTNEHLQVTMFDEKMSARQIFATDVLATVCIFCFAIFMIVYGIQLMQQSRNNTMAGLNIPYMVMYLSLPVSGVLHLAGLVSGWFYRMDNKEKEAPEK